MRPTDYVLNKDTTLPKLLSFDQELDCELRKRQYLKGYKNYDTISNEHETRKDSKRNKGKKDSEKENQSKYKTLTSQKGKNNESPTFNNLTDSEQKGLESIKKRIKQGELCVCQTDKSGRLAVLTKEQYIKAGLEHASKEKNYHGGMSNTYKTKLTTMYGG